MNTEDLFPLSLEFATSLYSEPEESSRKPCVKIRNKLLFMVTNC
jgi:hypothetical protein